MHLKTTVHQDIYKELIKEKLELAMFIKPSTIDFWWCFKLKVFLRDACEGALTTCRETQRITCGQSLNDCSSVSDRVKSKNPVFCQVLLGGKQSGKKISLIAERQQWDKNKRE